MREYIPLPKGSMMVGQAMTACLSMKENLTPNMPSLTFHFNFVFVTLAYCNAIAESEGPKVVRW